MTALVFENLSALPLQVRSLRVLLARWTRTLNKVVSARAAREVPEWRIQEVNSQIRRYRRSCSPR